MGLILHKDRYLENEAGALLACMTIEEGTLKIVSCDDIEDEEGNTLSVSEVLNIIINELKAKD